MNKENETNFTNSQNQRNEIAFIFALSFCTYFLLEFLHLFSPFSPIAFIVAFSTIAFIVVFVGLGEETKIR